MKKIIALIMAVIITVGILTPQPVAAATTSTDIIYCDDGGYILVEATTYNIGRSLSLIHYKELTKYTANDVKEWRVTLQANFTCNPGVSVICTYATCSTSIYDVTWDINSKNVSYSGNNASLTFYADKYSGGSRTRHDYHWMTISCDLYGNISDYAH